MDLLTIAMSCGKAGLVEKKAARRRNGLPRAAAATGNAATRVAGGSAAPPAHLREFSAGRKNGEARQISPSHRYLQLNFGYSGPREV